MSSIIETSRSGPPWTAEATKRNRETESVVGVVHEASDWQDAKLLDTLVRRGARNNASIGAGKTRMRRHGGLRLARGALEDPERGTCPPKRDAGQARSSNRRSPARRVAMPVCQRCDPAKVVAPPQTTDAILVGAAFNIGRVKESTARTTDSGMPSGLCGRAARGSGNANRDASGP